MKQKSHTEACGFFSVVLVLAELCFAMWLVQALPAWSSCACTHPGDHKTTVQCHLKQIRSNKQSAQTSGNFALGWTVEGGHGDSSLPPGSHGFDQQPLLGWQRLRASPGLQYNIQTYQGPTSTTETNQLTSFPTSCLRPASHGKNPANCGRQLRPPTTT